jgi:recombinational DNA repair protein (RecF pathway)
MSHHRYTTESIVLGGINLGEANRMLYLLTKDFGLIFATAQGVRLGKSKLRYSLQDFSRCKVDLVFGKSMWRIVDAQVGEGQFSFSGYGEVKAKIMARIFSLGRRLLHGEERNIPLFEEMNKFVDLIRVKNFNFSDTLLLEGITAARILRHLGYWGDNSIPESLFEGGVDEEKIKIASRIKSELFREVNKSLKETHL